MSTTLSLQDYDFHLPDGLIARYPSDERTASRLMVVDRHNHQTTHSTFSHVTDWLKPGDCLVVNNTKVINARLYGKKATGGQVECFIEEPFNHDLTQREAWCFVNCNRMPELPFDVHFDNGITGTVLRKRDHHFHVKFSCPLTKAMTDAGEPPIPPYFERHAEEIDRERYQTVFAKHQGAIAAPTAGLHFDDDLLDAIKAIGVTITNVTLHVGYGTFQPIKDDDIDAHVMHHEWYEVDANCCDAITQTQAAGGRIIAVGTTGVRALESAWLQHQALLPSSGMTNLFIKPGFDFHVVDGLITNFHIPKSTLLLLVSAFVDANITESLYPEAIREGYHFYSYGDAMFITP